MLIRRLDRYVLRTFLGPLLLTVLFAVVMYVVIDTAEHLEKVLEHHSRKDLLYLLTRYHLYRVPILLPKVTAAMTLIAVTIALVRLSRQNELQAMKALGLNLQRVVAPLLVGAFIVAAAVGLMQEVMLPDLSGKIQKTTARLFGSGGPNPYVYENIMVPDSNRNVVLIARSYHSQKRTFEDAELVKVNPDEDLHGPPCVESGVCLCRQISGWEDLADLREFIGQLAGNGNLNRRDQAKCLRQLDLWQGREIRGQSIWLLKGYRFLLGPDGRRQKRENFKELWLTDLTPDRLIEKHFDPDLRSTAELMRMTRFLEERRHSTGSGPGELISARQRRLWVLIHSRLSLPLATIALVMAALPFVVRSETHSAMVGLVLALLVCAGFYLVQILLTDLGNRPSNVVPPWAYGWGVTIVFGALGIYHFRRIGQ